MQVWGSLYSTAKCSFSCGQFWGTFYPKNSWWTCVPVTHSQAQVYTCIGFPSLLFVLTHSLLLCSFAFQSATCMQTLVSGSVTWGNPYKDTSLLGNFHTRAPLTWVNASSQLISNYPLGFWHPMVYFQPLPAIIFLSLWQNLLGWYVTLLLLQLSIFTKEPVSVS